MKRFGMMCLVAAAAGFGVAGSALADGAIARGDDGRVGISYNFRGERGAAEEALSRCGRRCRIIATYRNSCAAIATSDHGAYGWARAPRMGRAEDAAMENCRREGGRGCRVAARACDDRG